MRLRSLLYVPASEARFVASAHKRGADAIILDLEDSVAPDAKDAARAGLTTSIASAGQLGMPVFVRVNADLATAKKDARAAVLGGAFGVLIAKADPQKVSELNGFLDEITDDQIRLIPLIEDAAALLKVEEIAAQPRVIALILGGEDFANSIGAMPVPEVLRHPKLIVHYAAKAHGLASFGLFRTVADYSDIAAISVAAQEAKMFGFDGATCIHPSAVSTLNAAFAPSPDEIAWATRLLKAAGWARKGAFVFEGQMIDAPVLARAKGILA